MNLRSFLYYSKADRIAVLILVVFFVLIAAVCLFLESQRGEEALNPSDREEVEAFYASLQEKEKSSYNTDYSSKGRLEIEDEEIPVVLEPFDPNEADSLQLRRLGLSRGVTQSILHYRAKGGVFRTVESFARIYTLKREQYEQLKPYICIGEAYQYPPKVDRAELKVRQDSLRLLYPVKFRTDTILDLNSVDTTYLQRVPGIGSAYARAIVSLRSRLGGFVRVEQLAEVAPQASEWYRWLAIKTPPIRSIQINVWDVDRLRMHPYINFYQAFKIVECRKRYGALKNLSQLAFYDEFTKEELALLEPYIDYRESPASLSKRKK